ncbi:MAG: M23 family metallopeptidase [Candidatus Obscuribacterales bacterium]
MKNLLAPLLIATLIYLLPPAGQAQPNSNSAKLRIEESKATNGEQRIALWLMPRQVLDATVTITGNLDNMQSTPALPCTFDITEQRYPSAKAINLVTCQQSSDDAACHYDWKYYWRIGARGGRADSSIYSLPFQKGTSHILAQGYGGTISHFAGTDKEFAVDFVMPIGTTVRAARAGQVIAVKADSNIGGMDPAQFKYAANYVMIRHSDGTYGSYEHLKQNGALVRLGQTVGAGDAIALSGNTGMSTGPHLHFEVFIPVDCKNAKTVPVRFKTATGVQDRLLQGSTYTN